MSDDRPPADEFPSADDALTPPTFGHSSYNLFGPQQPHYETFGEPFERIPDSPQRRRMRIALGVVIFVVFGIPFLLAVLSLLKALFS